MAAFSKNSLVTFIIPTLNSGRVLDPCLRSIRNQKYDRKKITILILDGGSTDDTLKIAKSYHCHIFHNPLKTSESGKALGIKKSTGEFIALIDSDNILPSTDWLNTMLLPFKVPSVIGSEPWEYTYRPQGGFIERYSSLTGVNDPYALIANIYDRRNLLRLNWNGLHLPVIDHRYYQSFRLTNNMSLPSIGANGTIYRQSFLKDFSSDYLIDVDIVSKFLSTSNCLIFAKVKCGIIHSYCESSILKFIKKQNRRVVDLFIYQSKRPGNLIRSHFIGNLKFVFYVILIFPMLFDTLKGFIKKPDPAWLFHPLACVITLYIYGVVTIIYKLGLLKPINRQQWQQ